jgi:hypothetical protein
MDKKREREQKNWKILLCKQQLLLALTTNGEKMHLAEERKSTIPIDCYCLGNIHKTCMPPPSSHSTAFTHTPHTER